MLFAYIIIALFFGCLMLIGLLFDGGDAHIDHDAAGLGDSDGGGFSSWFSLKVISAFGTTFGSSGAIAVANNVVGPLALAIALLSGVVIGYIVKRLICFLSSQEGSAAYNRASLAGQHGTLTMGILDDGVGEAQFVVDGQLVSHPARSCDGKAIHQGETVVVENVGSVLSVKRG